MTERIRREDSAFDPITGLLKTVPIRKTEGNLGQGFIPTAMEKPPESKGAINTRRNKSDESVLRHDLAAEEPAGVKSSRVTEGNLQASMIPDGDPDVPYVERPLLRQGPGEFGDFMIPRDKLGPGLQPLSQIRDHTRTASTYGRSNLHQTPLGLIAGEYDPNEANRLPCNYVKESLSGQYVRKYGKA